MPAHDDDAQVDLARYLDLMSRRRWVAASAWLIVVLSAGLWTFTTRPLYEAKVLLDIEKERGGSAVSSDGTMVQNSDDDYYQTQYRLLKSNSLLQQAYDKVGLAATSDFAQPHGVDKLAGAVVVVPVPRSRLVNVEARSHDRELAARIANAVADAFVAQNLASQLFMSKEVLAALEARQDEPGARKLYEGLPAVVGNPLVQQLKGEYAKLQAQAAEMSEKYTPKHPAMVALRSNIAALRAQIDGETDKIVQSLRTQLSGQLNGNNVRVVDPAVAPDVPIKPKKLRDLALGSILGLMLGFLAALIVDALDQSVRTQDEVERKLRAPFLGLLPLAVIRPSDRVYESLLGAEPSLTSESFRNLRTMVDLAGGSADARAILVSSTVQEEGKSYVAANLAVALAQLGQSVLLVDGDLRRPNLHRNLRLPNEKGLSRFLARAERGDEAAALLQDTDVPGLKAITSGPRPPNPSELLNTPRMSALLAWARGQFDRVVIDCTPMFPISDTLLWLRHVPAVVFVVRHGRTKAALARKALERLEEAGGKPLGVAVNAAKAGGLAYSEYGYSYQQYYRQYSDSPSARRAG